ncbi:MAG TPA: cytochrome c [Steroidobacteraceae bacterium]|jgi:cytochrome c oxidase cbb3-type subunit 3|nr:cytochrome c [Steroidobacteraceae bacterium]
MNRLTGTLLVVLAGCATGVCSADDAPSPATVKLYDTYCVQCHGVNRDGNGLNSGEMAVKPRDHTDSKAMGDTPDDLLFKAIKNGGLSVNKSVLMPTWGGVLTDEQIHDLVKYLRFVSKTKSS